jgi:hypothetical protein
METLGIEQDGLSLFLTGVLQDCANVGTGMMIENELLRESYPSMAKNNLFVFC